MTRHLVLLILPGLLFAFSGVAGAQTLAPAADPYFEHQVSTLEAQGYHSVRATNDAAGRVTAIDAEGSEVVVTFNPDQGTMGRVDYLHMVDE